LLSMTLQPIDDNSASAQMVCNVHINNPLGAKAGMQIFEVDMSLNMSYLGQTIASATTGKTTVPGSPTVYGKGTIKTPAAIAMSLPSKGAALARLAKDMVQKESITLGISGHTDTLAECSALGYQMHVSAIPVELPNLKAKPPLPAITVQGMGGLKDVQVVKHTIPGNAPDNTEGCAHTCGIQLEVTAMVNNPAPFGLNIGTMNAHIENGDGVILGRVSGKDVNMNPGSNTIAMTGRISPQGPAALSAAEVFFSNYFRNVKQTTKVVGIDASPSTVQWLHDVVNGLELKTTFPGAGDGFSVLTNLEILAMSMDLSATSDPRITATIKAKMQMPDGVDISIIKDVLSADMTFQMIDPSNGKTVGVVQASSSVKYANGYMTATVASTPLKVTDAGAMGQLIQDLLLSPTKELKMTGTASPIAITNMGKMKLTNTPFSGKTLARGFNAFKDLKTGASLMKVMNLDVVGGKDGSLNLESDCEVTNPSNVAASLGAVTLELWTTEGGVWPSVKVGLLHIDDFALGANFDGTYVTKFKKLKVTYTAPTGSGAAAGRNFLSQFVAGKVQNVVVRGPKDGSGSNIGLLKQALQNFKTSSSAPGLVKNRLLEQGIMHIPNLLHAKDLPTDLIVQNPLTAAMTVKYTNCAISACKKLDGKNEFCAEYFPDPVGWYTPDLIDEVVPGNGKVTLKTHPVKLHKLLSPEMIKTAFNSLGDGSRIKLRGNMTLLVGNTEMTVDYSEEDVPICLDYPFHSCKNWSPGKNTTTLPPTELVV